MGRRNGPIWMPFTEDFMRLIVLSIALVLMVGVLPAQDAKTVTPAEAAKKVDEQVTLRMEVKSSGMSKASVFLNSEEDHKSDKNFTVFIGREALAKFKDAKIDNPATHFKGKTILVTGKVSSHKDKPQIAVTAVDQIKIEEKK